MFGVTEIHSTFFVLNFFLNLRASVQETFFPVEVYPIEMLLIKAYTYQAISGFVSTKCVYCVLIPEQFTHKVQKNPNKLSG